MCRPLSENRRIIIIDDSEAIHEDFRKILCSDAGAEELSDDEAFLFGDDGDSKSSWERPFELDSALQGKDGLNLVSQAVQEGRPFAMAFVDMRMPPGWDGVETIERLWQADPELQVVICTAYSDYSWKETIDRLGMSDQLLILKKPFDVAEVSQLAMALTERWSLERISHMKQNDLERLVEERTADLAKMDAALRHKQKLEAIGSLAGGVAHEFNNLLQAMQGFTRFAQEGLDEDEQRFKDLVQVLKAGDRAAALTSQLLCFSRADQFEPQAVQVQSILTDLGNLLKPVIGAQIAVSIAPAEDDIHVFADPGGIQQVLLNLCVNARDAMPDGGRIMIQAKQTTAPLADASTHRLHETEQCICFSVTDTGTGMTQEQTSRIFEPFFTTKEVGKGTGLGLAMVHGFVEHHRGLINVDSAPNEGTTFHITLPGADPSVMETSDTTSVSSYVGSETLLIAEDEPMVRAVAERILTNAGYRVLTAKNGQEAVDLFIEHEDSISLTLLDVVMPILTGRRAFEQIRNIAPTAAVIFCTGYDPETSGAESFDRDNLKLVQKPFDPIVLLQTVRETIAANSVAKSALA
ncbi:MAG: response regulator [Planctomycetota bacterium]|nr:response regulator [Planctomycetota bacterium]MDA0918687.1 response regulator [Planctomycetota bacterium]